MRESTPIGPRALPESLARTTCRCAFLEEPERVCCGLVFVVVVVFVVVLSLCSTLHRNEVKLSEFMFVVRACVRVQGVSG